MLNSCLGRFEALAISGFSPVLTGSHWFSLRSRILDFEAHLSTGEAKNDQEIKAALGFPTPKIQRASRIYVIINV